MIELVAAGATGLLWLAAFALLALHVRLAARSSTGTAILAAYPAFFALQVILAQTLAAFGWLTTSGFLSCYAVSVTAAAALYAMRRGASATPRAAPVPAATATPAIAQTATPHVAGVGPVGRIALITTALVFGALTLFTLVVPVHIWDALAYHMPMIASYVQNGSLDAWPTQDLRQVYRVNAGELQMLNVVMLARSEAWIELPGLLALGVVLVASFELARLALGRRAAAWLTVLLVLTAPQIVVGAGSEKNDLAFTAVLLCSFFWVLRAALAPARATPFVTLAGLSAGIAATTKVMGLNVVGAVGLLGLVLAARRRLPLRHVFVLAAASVAAITILAGAVYLANFSRSAVPVGVAPDEIRFTTGFANVTHAAHFYLYELPLKRLASMPYFEHDFLHYGYLFPFMLGLGLAGFLIQIRRRHLAMMCLALLAASLFVSLVAVRLPIRWDQRFMIWLVPVLAIAALSWVDRLDTGRYLLIARVAAGLAVLNAAALLVMEGDRLFPRSVAHLVATGSLPRYLDVPIDRYAYMNAGFETIDELATSRDSVLYAGTDDSWMYAAWGPRFSRHVEGVSSADHAAGQVAGGTFRFVVLEAAASPEIVEAVSASTIAADYRLLTRNEDRAIFMRSTTSTPDGG